MGEESGTMKERDKERDEERDKERDKERDEEYVSSRSKIRQSVYVTQEKVSMSPK